MSMQIKIYKPAAGDYDVVDCLKYDKFYKQHRKMKDKYGVKKTTIEFEGMKEDVFYLPFVQTDKFFQGWVMKQSWYRHKRTYYIASSLKEVQAYCYKYMQFTRGHQQTAIEAYRYIHSKYEAGDIIEFAW